MTKRDPRQAGAQQGMKPDADLNSRLPRRGRPPEDPETVRSERVVTFLTRAQMRRLRGLAEARGQSMSAVCAEILVDSLQSSPTKPETKIR